MNLHDDDLSKPRVKACLPRKLPATRLYMTMLVALLLAAAMLAGNAMAAGPATEIRLAYLGKASDAALLGARQGLEEANLQGRFLGQHYSLDVLPPDGTADLSPYLAILGSGDSAWLRNLAKRAPQTAVFNLSADDDSLRTACIANLLDIIPSATMKNNAIQQWHSKHPGAQVAAVAWHHDFDKYAGRDLNKRFIKAFQVPMDQFAWAGWAAVKMTSDSVARGGIATAPALLSYLRGKLLFDGQKGVDMGFQPSGQLRQTLLLVSGDHIEGEAPVRGVADADDLESLDPAGCGNDR